MDWILPIAPPKAEDLSGSLHVWSLDLAAEDHLLSLRFAYLAREEQAKADRFRFPELKTRYVHAMGVLRELLGAYCSTQPSEILFARGKFGKPFLDPRRHPERIQFNMTHSPSLALFAFSDREVGIDIESLERKTRDMDDLADRFFSKTEAEFIHTLENGEKREEFFRCWTRKETYIKAIGEGLHHPLDKFIVSLGSPEARLVSSELRPGDPERWSFMELRPRPDHIGAVAIDGPMPPVSLNIWRGQILR